MGTLLQDLRFALRMLAKNPGFTAVAVLTLALGIGANTAIFSLIDSVMLKTLPVKNPEQLMLFSWTSQKWPKVSSSYSSPGGCPEKAGATAGCSFSYPTIEQFRQQKQLFSEVFAFTSRGQLAASTNNQNDLATGEFVSGNYFSGLSVETILGRSLTEEDDKPGAEPAAVISYGYWERKYGRDSSAVGKSIALNSIPFTIVGVSPREFFGVQEGFPRDMWLPLATYSRVVPNSNPAGQSLLDQRNR